VKALEKRISSADKARITLREGDCNLVVDDVLKSISSRTLGLAFIDPEGFEVDFAHAGKAGETSNRSALSLSERGQRSLPGLD